MSLSGFLAELVGSPRLQVGLPVPLTQADRDAAADPLKQMDALARQDAPGLAPALDLNVAVWAAESLYRGCQFLVFREVDAPVVESTLATPCPTEQKTPSVHWSADVCFRYLPDLLSLARGLAPEDPLVRALKDLAKQFPLACTTEEVDPTALKVVMSDACLRTMLVDRIIARKATGMLAHADVREAVRAAMGMYSTLMPAIAEALRRTSQGEKESAR